VGVSIPKEGPSAGIAITSTLISLALGKPANKQVAMTGEINLSGHVGKIGGVKEKVLGAKREGIHNIILPS
jgi:ATP-dependent Lon protease